MECGNIFRETEKHGSVYAITNFGDKDSTVDLSVFDNIPSKLDVYYASTISNILSWWVRSFFHVLFYLSNLHHDDKSVHRFLAFTLLLIHAYLFVYCKYRESVVQVRRVTIPAASVVILTTPNANFVTG